jgi:excisionase family DNA binding protein
MNINELIESGANITIQTTPNDLFKFLEQVAEKIKPEKPQKYLSPKQVCEMLNIDNSTLWRWGQNNYLPPLKVGGKNRYRLSDIQKLMENETA